MSLPALSPDTNKWSKYMLEIYTGRKAPPLGTVAVKELEEKAREKMKDHISMYRACTFPNRCIDIIGG